VELQHGLEDFAVMVSARGVAAVFLGKVTCLNYCCANWHHSNFVSKDFVQKSPPHAWIWCSISY